jgi:SAM-dependent methyltransferase
MYDDISDLRDFYHTHQGHHVAVYIRQHIAGFWNHSDGCCNVALGFATPFLRHDHVDAALMPTRYGAHIWPTNRPVRSTLVDPHSLPIPDVQIDRLLLAHALEFDPDPGRLLSECWRVLDGAGRLQVMVPHRNGIWARAETTPFGHGRPYSRRQLRQILSQNGFETRSIKSLVYMPPMASGWMFRFAPGVERVGGRWWPALGGVLLAEADKMLYAPAGKTSKLRAEKARVGSAQWASQSGSVTQRKGNS